MGFVESIAHQAIGNAGADRRRVTYGEVHATSRVLVSLLSSRIVVGFTNAAVLISGLALMAEVHGRLWNRVLCVLKATAGQ